MKRCSRCHTIKPYDAFNRDKARRDGRSAYCRECISAYKAAYFEDAENAEKRRVYDRKRRKDPAYRAYKRANERLHRKCEDLRVENFSVENLRARDGDDCSLCGEPLGNDITIEHRTPLSRGGHHTLENCALAHRMCNCRKGRLTLKEWNQRKGR